MAVPLLLRQPRAAVAVELALVLPIYLIVVFGLVDVGRFFIWVDQARRAAFVAGNAASQCCSVTNATTGDITVQLTAANMYTILSQVAGGAPSAAWGTANGLVLTAMTTGTTGIATTELQSRYPTTLTATSSYTCVAGSSNVTLTYDPSDTVVIGEVFYTFKPWVFLSRLTGWTGSITIHDNSVFRVRQPLTLTSPTTC